MPANRHAYPRRFPRRGTIMIMVVALLVMLMLIGTAWIATVSTDRGASQRHIVNNRADLLMSGLAEMVQGKVGIGELMGFEVNLANPVQSNRDNLFFRPRSDQLMLEANGIPVQGSRVFSNTSWTCPIPDYSEPDLYRNARKDHLGSRIPFGFFDSQNRLTNVIWPAISGPLAGVAPVDNAIPLTWHPTAGTASTFNFESPWRDPDISSTISGPAVVQYRQRLKVQPTSITLKVNGVDTAYPAFRIAYGNPNAPAQWATVLAADTDGDGIADAGLWPLPGGQQDGVTWYAAVRIIDNNSALNAGTAWEWNSAQPGGYLNTNFFPTNINIAPITTTSPIEPSIVRTTQEMQLLNDYRFAQERSGLGTPSTQIYDDVMAPVPAASYLSRYDAAWSMLGRRLDNPGYNFVAATLLKCQGYTINDQAALAYRFIYDNVDAYTKLEQKLSASLPGATNTYKYADADVLAWYQQNFETMNSNSADVYNRRCIVVTRNPVGNQTETASASPNFPLDMRLPPAMEALGAAYPSTRVKASLNTAAFAELWAAYWNVMVDRPWMYDENRQLGEATPFWRQITENVPALSDPYYGQRFTTWDRAGGITQPNANAPTQQTHPARMLRSVIRDFRSSPGARMDPSQVLLLRSAIAAANTVQLRNPAATVYMQPRNISGQVVPIRLRVNSGGLTDAFVRIYPTRQQPFVTEVYVNTDTSEHTENQNTVTNKWGYVAIELHNPYSVPLSIENYKLCMIDRYGSGTYRLTLQELKIDKDNRFRRVGNDATSVEIPANGYLVLENYKEGAKDNGAAEYRPLTARGGNFAKSIYVPELYRALDKELVLMRPEDQSLVDAPFDQLVPVDQYDFRGVKLPTGNNDDATAVHYVRNTKDKFRCVYPGRYVGNSDLLRQQGTQMKSFPQGQDPWEQAPPVPGVNLGVRNDKSSYEKSEFTIQIANSGPGTDPNWTSKFPFGGFARTGDVLQVPFIAAYTIKLPNMPAGQFLEVNSVTMDSVLAEDTFTDDDPYNVSTAMDKGGENIGRFCPILGRNNNAIDTGPNGDWDSGVAAPLAWRQWRYRWAMKIFDYVTVLAPHDDYLPNATLERLPYFGVLTTPGKIVANADPAHKNVTPTDDFEKTVGVNGLVNINTAPWRVLAQVPWVVNSDPIRMRDDNAAIARQIAYYRDIDDGTNVNNPRGHGPFKNLFELYNVQAVRDHVAGIIGTDPDDEQGDITPPNSSGNGADGVRGDFEDQYLFITRASNLITTRSDSFTCYLLVQGWKYAGDNTRLELVAQRRMGFILDRNSVTPFNSEVKTVVFPAE